MGASWLDSLSSHPIFELPESSSSGSALPSLSTHPSLSELARPPSPALSTIFGHSAATANSNGASRRGGKSAREERDTPGGRKVRCVLARGVDLIVAVGQQLRIASLSDTKGRAESASGDSAHADLGEYKTLHTPSITFDIQHLVLNSTSKLLAVVGLHSIAVVVLPRKGWAGSIGRELDCRSLVIGRFYHSLPASPPVAQVSWHPWGDNSSSLLVLTSDATLREYAIADDAEEPAQTVSLARAAPATDRNSRGAFSSDDVDESTAVAFSLGQGESDWGPLTLYGLMRSGDIVALCPFLPKKAAIPASYIHSLAAFISTKVDSLPAPSSSLALTHRSSTSTSSPSPHPPQSSLATLYAHQLKFVNALVAQASTAPLSASEDSVRVLSPRAPAPATRQGPFLMQPAPHELENGHEPLACDLAYVTSAGLGVFAIAYQDGKVDLCLEVDKVEARWGSHPHEDEDGEEEELPLLAVYESVDLGLAEVVAANGGGSLETNYPTFVSDPVYPDVLYVYHALGAHCLLMAKWLDAVADVVSGSSSDEPTADDEAAIQKVAERTLREQEPTEVLWVLKTDTTDRPVVGLVVVNDVYLGYSLLVLTSALQLVAIALHLRVPPLPISSASIPSSSSHQQHAPSRLSSSDPPAYLSLLEGTPFTPPTLLSQSSRSSLPSVPRRTSSTSTPLTTITPTSLRSLGTTVNEFRAQIHALVGASNAVQVRLETQMKELSRQLRKLEELSRLSAELRRSTTSDSSGEGGLQGRLEKVTRNQEELVRRTDRVLQRLMDAHEPELSQYERKWFAELERLEKEIEGAGGGAGGASLEMRVERVQGQLESLKPALEEIRRKDGGGGVGTPKKGALPVMGESQVRKLEVKLAEE
ncbi:hypothetical protein RQP46_001903 [Phenoliferia psychrophenolica]